MKIAIAMSGLPCHSTLRWAIPHRSDSKSVALDQRNLSEVGLAKYINQ
ncbi:hypothetical protein K0A96_00620 [Patescibacteria group bacterium]|nr:hypothetical protein [Patescibacteria group bacterium]